MSISCDTANTIALCSPYNYTDAMFREIYLCQSARLRNNLGEGDSRERHSSLSAIEQFFHWTLLSRNEARELTTVS